MLGMPPLTPRQYSVDSRNRVKALRDLASVLATKSGVQRTHVKAGVKQLAWVQLVQGRELLFCIFLNLYHPAPWRITDKYIASIPRTFARDDIRGKLGSTLGFEWSFLADEYDASTIADLLHSMANEGDTWNANSLNPRWSIFPETDHAHYAWSVRGKKFIDEHFRVEEQQRKARLSKRAARLTAVSFADYSSTVKGVSPSYVLK